MPELPEVETVRRGLAERVIGDRIDSVWLGSQPQTFQSKPQEIARALEGSGITDVRRMGKYIVICLAPPPSPSRRSPVSAPADQCIVHLGMSGALQVTGPEAEILNHTHFILRLASGKEVRFVDPRRFGRIRVCHDFALEGLEPLETGFQEFAALFHKRKTPIKSALLNQKLLRGLGNIYADESLFRAGIRPHRKAASLRQEELNRLWTAIRRVLRQAIAAGGSSISDYFDVNGDPGLFQMQHRVYGRKGEPCTFCGTPIKRIVLAGRSSHYCSECQR
jgi:formamidopyrimidine-DNA glycosylase